MAPEIGTSITSTTPEAASRPAPAGSVEKAFALLQAVVAADEPVGVRELARRTGIARSSVSRLLATLGSLGMIDMGADGAVAGPGLATLTTSAAVDAGLAERCHPLLVALTDTFGESAAVTIDTPSGARYIAHRRSDSAVQVPDATGQQFPFHVVAPGLVLMSAWSEPRLRAYLAGELASPTPHSVVDPQRIAERLSSVRASGIAWTDQELDLEVNGVAVGLYDSDAKLVASVSLHGPAYRLAPDARPDLGADLGRFVTERSVAIFGL